MSLLEFCFFHALGIFCHCKRVYHILDVAIEKTLQVVGGITDTMVGHTTLWEIVGANLGAAVTCRNERFATAGNIVYIFLVLLVVYKGAKA